MAKGAGPTTEQLLELLQRAAEELKHAQSQASTAVSALQKEQAANQQTEQELEAAQKKLKELLKKQAGLTDAQGKVSELELKVAELESNQQSLQESVDAERQRARQAEESLEGALAERETLRGTVAQLEQASLQERTERDEATQAQRSELEQAAQQQRQDLEEAHRKALAEEVARRTEAEANQRAMLDDAAGRLVTAEGALATEKDKHSQTAQKLLEARSKVRELESALAHEQERVKGLETSSQQLADEQRAFAEAAAQQHAADLTRLADEHRRATADLQTQLAAARAQLAQVTDTWHQVEHQYESLHREMLLVLEQRDEARRMLDNERTEKERLSRALQSR